MNDLRQAAQQALEALEGLEQNYGNLWQTDKTPEELDALCLTLRTALEQDDKDRVWIEERKANWALQRKMAQETQERDRQRREYEEARNAALSAEHGEQPEQTQDSTCNNTLRAQGKAYPRTCKKCGFGPCIADRVQLKQEPVETTVLLKDLPVGKLIDTPPPRRESQQEPEQEWLTGCPPNCGMDSGCDCEALEQPEQEPVAWTLTETLDRRETTTTGYLWFSNPQNSAWTPIYTHPPRREWRGLTTAEIDEISDRIERSDFFDIVIPFARAIEAALKEKNA